MLHARCAILHALGRAHCAAAVARERAARASPLLSISRWHHASSSPHSTVGGTCRQIAGHWSARPESVTVANEWHLHVPLAHPALWPPLPSMQRDGHRSVRHAVGLCHDSWRAQSNCARGPQHYAGCRGRDVPWPGPGVHLQLHMACHVMGIGRWLCQVVLCQVVSDAQPRMGKPPARPALVQTTRVRTSIPHAQLDPTGEGYGCQHLRASHFTCLPHHNTWHTWQVPRGCQRTSERGLRYPHKVRNGPGWVRGSWGQRKEWAHRTHCYPLSLQAANLRKWVPAPPHPR